MRTLTTAQTALVSAEEAQAHWLFKLSADSTICLTNADSDIIYGGNKYLSHGFEVEGVNAAANFGVDSVRVNFDNVDREFSQLLLSDDVANKPAILYLQHQPKNIPSSNVIPNQFCETTVGWFSGGAGLSTYGLSTEYKYAGDYSIKFGADTTVNAYIQTTPFVLEKGMSYSIETWVRSNTTRVVLTIRNGDNEGNSYSQWHSFTSSTEMQELSATFTALAGGSSAFMRISNGQAQTGEWWIDRVLIRPVVTTAETIEAYNGFVTQWSIDNLTAQVNIGSEFMLWSKKTLRLPTPNCPWSFKGSECAYAGAETWCDKSPDRCSELDNYSNFGGRKFIADLEGQKIFWGPQGY
jgi:hypothetical protein